MVHKLHNILLRRPDNEVCVRVWKTRITFSFEDSESSQKYAQDVGMLIFKQSSYKNGMFSCFLILSRGFTGFM